MKCGCASTYGAERRYKGRRLGPNSGQRRNSTGPASRNWRVAVSSSRSAVQTSIRARSRPGHLWIPWPKLRCWWVRRRRKRSGSVNTSGSRLAAKKTMATTSPDRMRCPSIMTSQRAVLAVARVGGYRRNSSSTASGTLSGWSRSHCWRERSRARCQMALPRALVVLRSAATNRARTNPATWSRPISRERDLASS